MKLTQETFKELSLLEMKKQLSPREFSATLRGKGELFWWPKGNFWVVTDYKLGEVAMRSPDYSADRSAFFISRMPNLDLGLITDFFSVVSRMMVMSDNPQHLQRRKIAATALNDEVLEYYRPKIEAVVKGLFDRTSRKSSFDFVSDIAMLVPSVVLADLFRIPDENRADFYRWSNNMTQFFGGSSQYRNEDGVTVNESTRNIRDYFEHLLAKRKKNPSDDFLSTMLRQQATFGLDDNDLIAQAIMMLVAGQVTTTDQICNNLFTLLSEDQALRKLRANPELLPLALEEFNRLDPAVTFLFRVVKKETQLGKETLPVGAVVFISAHAVNRDPQIFENPDLCQIDRKFNPHFAYGHGPHFCLGAKLARIEMASCFQELLRRFPQVALASPEKVERKHSSLAFSGFERLGVLTRGGVALPS